tara:strand:- start:3350 stop:3619 length:270 start_codon:yes stop_codon:yes gene_type:complete
MYELSSDIRKPSAEQLWTDKHGTPRSEKQITTILEHYNMILDIANSSLFLSLKKYLYGRDVNTAEIEKRKKEVIDIKQKIKDLQETKNY